MYIRANDPKDHVSNFLDRVQVNALEDLLDAVRGLGDQGHALARGIELTLEPGRSSKDDAMAFADRIREHGAAQAADSFARYQRVL